MSELLKHIEKYAKLKAVGPYLKGKCPFCFCDGGFTYSKPKGVFYCFCCHSGGGSIKSFDQEVNLDVSWRDIVRKVKSRILVAKKAGDNGLVKEILDSFLCIKKIAVDAVCTDSKIEAKVENKDGSRLEEVAKIVANWFRDQLNSQDEPLRSVVNSFGITDFEANALQIGFFPPGKSDKFIKDMGLLSVTEQDLISMKLIFKNINNGRYYSGLEGRIICPVRILGRSIQGFCGVTASYGDDRIKFYSTHLFPEYEVIDKYKELLS